MRRIIVMSPSDQIMYELAPGDVFDCRRIEEVNGEHALSITTTRVLRKPLRLLLLDFQGIWHEYVVTGEDRSHQNGLRAFGTYYCVWSIQHDLSGVPVSAMPGVQYPVTARAALTSALSTTSRWTVGTVTQWTTSGASMYQMSAWKALSVLVENWGGEIGATIDVGAGTIIARKVDLLEQEGAQIARRRFDYGSDIVGIHRAVEETVPAARIIPRGKGEETEGGGYGRKITIASVNDGVEWLQNDDVAAAVRLPNGSGGWEYPTIYVDNEDMETPAALKEWALGVLEDYTVPRVSYTADVLQFANAGMDAHGLALGDAVQIVDRVFADEPLRLNGRVQRIEYNELNDKDVTLTIGNLGTGLPGYFDGFAQDLAKVHNAVSSMNGGNLSTADYLANLLDRINAEVNAMGGYSYIVPGEGIITYDVAVDDPLIGNIPNTNPVEYASYVTQMKGGSIRIADTKKPSFSGINDWNWKTVIVSGHIAAEVVTAANITAGYIGDAEGDFYIDLDAGVYRMPTSALGSGQGLYVDPATGNLYINGSYIKAGAIDASLITAGTFQVKDSSDNILFSANAASRLVTMAGFNVQNGSLYRGLSSLSGSTNGVFVGTGGLATVGNQQRIAMANGNLAFANLAHSVTGGLDISAAFEMSTSWEYGMRLFSSQLLGLECTRLLVRSPNGTWARAISSTRKAIDVTNMALSNNLLTANFNIATDHIAKGLLVYGETTPGTPDVTQTINATLTTKNYVDNKVSDATDDMATQTWANNRFLRSSDLSGYATQGWVTGQGYLTSVPSGYATEAYVQNAIAGISGASFSYDSSTNTLTITS
ncbi:MAG: phage tail protein [Eggerthellaceae bacterium]|nr:phage tail protein [Eggerthellaceae bacterium]